MLSRSIQLKEESLKAIYLKCAAEANMNSQLRALPKGIK